MSDARPGVRQAVVALRYPNYRLFYVALLVSAIGGQLLATANLWQIYELTGSPLQLGLAGLARAIPVIGLSLMGGVIADRVDRRRLVAALQGVAGLAALGLAAVTVVGQVNVWHIYAATMAAALIQALGNPARTAMIPNLVPRDHLMNALSLNATIHEISMIIGPAIAGLSIAAVGLFPTYVINGVAHVLSIAALLVMHLPPVTAPRPEPAWRSLVDGLVFVRSRSIILVMVVMDTAMNLLGTYRVLLPFFAADNGLGAEGLGLLLSAPAVGGLLGASALMSLGNVPYKGLIAAGSLIAYCFALGLLAWSPFFVVSLVACGLLGSCDSVQRVVRATIIQSVTPDAFRGRVTSFQSTVTSSMPSLGQLSTGALATAIGPAAALAAGAVACTAILVGIVAARRDLRAADLASAMERDLSLSPSPAPGGGRREPPRTVRGDETREVE